MHLAPAHVGALASAQEDGATQRSRPSSGNSKPTAPRRQWDERRAGQAVDLPTPTIRHPARRASTTSLLPRRLCRPAPLTMELLIARTRAGSVITVAA